MNALTSQSVDQKGLKYGILEKAMRTTRRCGDEFLTRQLRHGVRLGLTGVQYIQYCGSTKHYRNIHSTVVQF